MKCLPSGRTAADVLLAALALLAVFHVLVLTAVLPADIVWGGGAANSRTDAVGAEAFSLALTILFGLVVAGRAGRLKLPGLSRTVRVGTWVVFAYFALNTLGNLTASSSVERIVFTAVSASLALLALRVATSK